MKNTNSFDRISHVVLRRPGKNFAEATGAGVGIPDYDRAVSQQQTYREALEKCGAAVSTLPPASPFSGECSVNNAAVVTEYLAVIGNFPDNAAEQEERKNLAAALAGSRIIRFITSPGLMDANDTVQIGDRFYIGLSPRTNQEGAAQLAFFLMEYGYQVTMVDIPADSRIRLGSSVAYLGQNRILISEELSRHFSFIEYEKIIVSAEEHGAASSLMVNGTLLMPAGYAETLEEVRSHGIPVVTVNVSEFEKTGQGLSSLSLCLTKVDRDAVIELPAEKNKAKIRA